jgi:energy-coupling factor transporter transmembrane protein EcfT
MQPKQSTPVHMHPYLSLVTLILCTRVYLFLEPLALITTIICFAYALAHGTQAM